MDDSPFGKLSPELRNAIYSLVLPFDHPFEITAEQDSHKLRIADGDAQMQPLAITAVCRQIRGETKQMFYHLNSFHIQLRKHKPVSRRDEAGLLQKFWDGIGDTNAAALCRITVDLQRSYYARNLRGCGNIKHQLRALRAFAKRNPACELFACVSEEDSDYRDASFYRQNVLPKIKFRVDATGDGLSKALVQVKAYTDEFSAIPTLEALIEYYKCLPLQSALQEAMVEIQTSGREV